MSTNAQRWYHQPVMWLAVALPAASVVAGIALVIAAHSGLDASPDRVVRVAQIQTTDASRDQKARALSLAATARFDGDAITVVLGGAIRPEQLELELIHATDASHDRRVTLLPCGDAGYCASVGSVRARFHLALADAKQQWRIVGTREAGAALVVLGPALASP
jgi:uncharacterized protein